LPLFGLILIGCELSQHLRLPSPVRWTAASTSLLVLGAACYERNQAWSRPSELFMDAASRSTRNARPYLNLTEMLVRERRCELAPPFLERAERLFPHDARVQVAWSWALECLGRPNDALRKLMVARDRDPSPRIYEQIGFLYGEMGRVDEAGQTLREAVARYPNAATTHDALAFWHESTGDLNQAEAEYRKSLSLDDHDANARLGLMRVLSKRRAQSR
jgi:Flp pilus assembly protein TadD